MTERSISLFSKNFRAFRLFRGSNSASNHRQLKPWPTLTIEQVIGLHVTNELFLLLGIDIRRNELSRISFKPVASHQELAPFAMEHSLTHPRRENQFDATFE